MTTRKIDVLAVMDAAAEGMGGPTDLGLRDARAVVADLITKARDLENGAVGADSTERLLLARLRDALTRIGGDK